MKPRRKSVAAAAWWLMAGPAAAAGTLAALADEPRAYGYRVGDTVTRQVAVDVPEGLKLDAASLPQVGRQGQSFELRRVDWQGPAGAGQHKLVLEYQVFRAPPEVRTLELPPVTLRFAGQPRAQDLRIDAWPVTVAPLVPVDVSPRRGLGELQPDTLPPLINTHPARQRLLAYGAAVLLALAYLAHVYAGAPWLARRGRPFERAWRALRAHAGCAADPAVCAAFQELHRALNSSAGVVLFEHGIDPFLSAQPRYAPLRADLTLFFQSSKQQFFGGGGDLAPQQQLQWLQDFCRRCRDAERGAA